MQIIDRVKSSIKSRKFTRRNRSIGGDLGLMVLLGAFALFSAYPLIYAINNAFKPLSEIFLFPPKLFVQNPTMDNFFDLSTIIGNSWVPFSRYMFNTLFITILGTGGTVLLGTMAAYPLAKYNFPGSKVMSNIIVYALMFNSTVTAIPNYIIMSKAGLVNTYWAVILPVIGSTLGLYLMKNFIVQIPTSLIEAAKIDGAAEFRVFWTVIIPLCKPAWITLCILSFQTLWGATGGNFIYSENLKPISYALSQVVGGGIARTGVASAVSLIMMIVPVTVFVISQSNVIETMASSGMKD
ncbi:carbohydrate ABC transporter permease [Zhenhengia yiwuensis]|uniref:Carbohydrate ABC transporter permease n=1 Tax=Zhenhengia yiwuensis TaxID=2763666 RepID=A0A926I7U5_9FIRM|nr:carbohydrate ABC transporter permease [Zhenhengia yiwuensis]MBC8577955.1 carbohydrate ABC transporter permease [Zhenhengia yiwuensis]MBP3912650.1 carbohydrate ABC transporter permease [Niameybacter sp.]MBS5798667.1 carbohydrate ABC transporter permease [Clostridiales bacterium]